MSLAQPSSGAQQTPRPNKMRQIVLKKLISKHSVFPLAYHTTDSGFTHKTHSVSDGGADEAREKAELMRHRLVYRLQSARFAPAG